MIFRGVRDFRSAGILIAIAIVSSVMARPRTLVYGEDEKVSLVTEWSHRHVVYSAPKSYVRAFHLSQDPRYVQQWVRRNAERKHHHHDREWFAEEPGQVHGDWSMYLGNGGTTGDGVFPAKFSFDVTTANCGSAGIPDFVVF